MDSYADGFADSDVAIHETTPVAYVVTTCLLVIISIAIVVPIACLGGDHARRRKVGVDRQQQCNDDRHHGTVTASSSMSAVESNNIALTSCGTPTSNNLDLNESVFHHTPSTVEYHPQQRQQQHAPPERNKAPHNVADVRIFHGELLAAMKVMATERRFDITSSQQELTSSGAIQPQHPASYPQMFPPASVFHRSGSFTVRNNGGRNATNSEKLSAIPSIATTSRLHRHHDRRGGRGKNPEKKNPFGSLMPWSHNRPISRTDTIQRSVWKERQSQYCSQQGNNNNNLLSGVADNKSYNNDGNGSHTGAASRLSRSSWGADGQVIPFKKSRVVSGPAGTCLEDEAIEGEAEYYRKRYIEQQKLKVRLQKKAVRNPSISGHSLSDNGSIMPPLSSSVLAPQDAADANDPGRIPSPMKYRSTIIASTGEYMNTQGENVSECLSTIYSYLLELAEYNYESHRLVSLAIVPTISAMADPLFRLVLIAIISNYIGTDPTESMVAYVLVIFFIRITTMEISGAIADAESNMLQDSFLLHGCCETGFYHAGQTMQLSIFFQVVIGLPVLLMWCFTMDNVVQWLVHDSEIATKASRYCGVIIIDYLIRSASRSFMLPFHLMGQGQFEKYVDIIATVLTVVAIAIVAATNGLTLVAIGWIQVIIGIAKAITKVAYVVFRGWLVPYQQGLLKSWACKSTSAVAAFLSQAFPLFLGSLLELGEWEVLLFFVRHLGGAEVATWAIMGVIWEVFQAMTEGLGEAASVRVSFYLTEGLPQDAKKLAHKIAFLSIILVLLVTSVFFMVGPNLSILLSTNHAIRYLLWDLVGSTGLAMMSMTFAQVYWSLAGAQGRFGLASATILFCRWLVMLPTAAICIFGHHHFDLTSVTCAIAVGYAIAVFVLAHAVFASDWEQLAYNMRDDGEVYGEADFLDDGAGIVDEVDDGDDFFDEDDESEEESGDEESILEEGEYESSSPSDEESNLR